MATKVTNRGALILVNGQVDWDGSTSVGVLLTTNTFVPTRALNTVSEVTNELSGGGYVRKTLASRTLTESDANNRVELDAADVTWTALGAAAGTPRWAIVYDNTNATDATRETIGYVDLTPDEGVTPAPTPNGSDYTVVWPATGIFRLNTT